jgi:hypothetical protein
MHFRLSKYRGTRVITEAKPAARHLATRPGRLAPIVGPLLVAILCALHPAANAQFLEANQLVGEFGVQAGVGHYFGDLNTRASLNRPKIALGVLFRKQFGKYIALRVQGTYAKLGYSDTYSKNQTQQLRNLSFNSDLLELAIMGDFNFFRFIPGEPGYSFTPYVTMGAGFFTYDPYAYLADEKYYLRPLGTEGQGSALYPDRKPYGTAAFCLPIGVGLKYNLNYRTNLTFEVCHRFTGTDYLDDVSTTYAGSDAFPVLPNGDPSPALLLQDRSYELTGVPIGIAGRQRGISAQKDQYVTITVGLTFNLMTYKCPTAN